MAIRKSLLPSAYQQVEYIESSGTQYIDTGFVPSNTSGAKIKFYKTNNTDLLYFGVREQTITNSRWSMGTTTYLYCGFNDVIYFELNGSRPTLNNNEIYNVEFNYKNDRKLKLNGDVGDNDLTNITLTSITKNAYIFAANWGGTPNYFQSCRLYNLIFTDNETIVRNFIPCYRKSDSVIGLYDLVNGVFYTNAGSGTFTKGNDVVPKIKHIYKGSTRIIKQYKGTSLYFYDVPSIYQRVKYIEATGTQYINTGIETSNNSWVLECVFKRASTMNGTIFGATGGFEVYLESSQPNYKALGITSSVQADVNTFNTIRLNPLPVAGGVVVLNVDGSSNSASGQTYSFGNTIGLCGRGDGTRLIAGSFGEFKVSRGSTTLIHLLPCYRKSDNVVGMYDVISGQLFTNNGTGTFGKGADL